MPPRIYGLLTVLLAAASGTALAAGETADVDVFGLALEDLGKLPVSIATGSQQPLSQAPSTATVITADTIAALGATDLDQVLETVPGLHVQHVPGSYEPIYEMRGIGTAGPSNPRVLLLQDGQPMNTLFTGDQGQVWAGYPVDNIERIEVIRGPGSALYGANAFAGVINIITKTADDAPGTTAGLRDGSYQTRDAWVQHGSHIGPLAVAGYVRAGSSEGAHQTISEDDQSGLDSIFGTHASLAPGPLDTGYHALDANLDLSQGGWRWRGGYKLRDEVGTGAGIGYALDPVGKGRSERINSDLDWTLPATGSGWGAGATVSYLQDITTEDTPLRVLPPGAALPTGSFPDGMIGAPEYWDRQLRFSAFSTYSGWQGQQWRLGVGHDILNLYRIQEYKNFTFTPSGLPVPIGAVEDFTDTAPFIEPHLREVNYAYMQDEWALAPAWALTAGLRHDQYSDAGGSTNPRLALVWQSSSTVTSKLLYGTAFRAPSFNEAYSINNPVEQGNPDLHPETLRNGEADVSWQARHDLQASLSLFSYQINDIIRPVANATPGTGATVENSGNQDGHGGELELVWQALERLRLSGNYAYQHGVDKQTGGDAGYAPHRHVFVMADWRLNSYWMMGAQGNWVAQRERTAGDTRPPVPDYTTLDLNLRYSANPARWSLTAGVRNVFAADAREPTPAPSPGQAAAIPDDLPVDPRTLFLQGTVTF